MIAGALGVISFGLGNAPSGSGPQGAAVQIKAGLGDDVSNEMVNFCFISFVVLY